VEVRKRQSRISRLCLASILIDVLIDADALKILGQEPVNIDLLEQTDDRDGSKFQLELDDLEDRHGQKFRWNDVGCPKFLGLFPDLRP